MAETTTEHATFTTAEQAAFFEGGDGVAMRQGGWTWPLGQLAGEFGEHVVAT